MSYNSTNNPSTPSFAGYTLSDVWRAMKTDRHFNHAFWLEVTLSILCESFVKAVTRAMVVIAVILITSVSICGFFVLLPRISRPYSAWMLINIVWGKIIHNPPIISPI